VARFLVGPPDDALAPLVVLDSTAKLALPSLDIDSDTTYEFELRFYAGEVPLVVFSGYGEVERSVVEQVIAVLADDLASEDGSPYEWEEMARHAMWLDIRLVRRRIRRVEASVRDALADDHISADDYAALRDYPARLAKVERLVGELPGPTWTQERRSSRDPLIGLSSGLDMSWKARGELGGEAREAVARLSGLIASQQVVLASRQAAETERFQRLLTLVGTAVLVPGLVAAIFGANVGFRGRDTREAFWAMLLFMVGGGVASYALLRSLQLNVWSRIARRIGLARLAGVPDVARLVLLVVIAGLAIAGGAWVLDSS
jgi:hypothetical protein